MRQARTFSDGIQLVQQGMEAAFAQACLLEPVLGASMYTHWKCYGANLSDLLLWIAFREGRHTAALTRNGPWLDIVANRHANLPELREFLRVLGGFSYLQATEELCDRLELPEDRRTLFRVMACEAKIEEEDPAGINTTPALGDIHPIIQAGDELFARLAPWEIWYPHTSHLLRHGLGLAVTLEVDGMPVSTAGIYTRSLRYDVIGSVATLENCRGRGYASRLVRHLTCRSQARGKIPVLYCAPDLEDFYAALGYRTSHNICRVELPER